MPGMSLGIDLGTYATRIHSTRGLLLNEPTIVAIDITKNKVFATGKDAYEMIGRTPPSIELVLPLNKGAISSYEYASMLLKKYIKKVCALRMFKPTAVISVPSGVTEVERRSFLEATFSAGVRKVALLEEAIAAAIGANLDFVSPNGTMVVNVGAGSTDIAVLSLKGVVTSLSKPLGGNNLDEDIIHFVHSKYSLHIGMKTAQKIKCSLGNACFRKSSDNFLEVKGRDLATGMPKLIKLSETDIFEAMSDTLSLLLSYIREVLESTPPELAADIIENGISLSGGSAKLKNLDTLIEENTGVHCIIPPDPELCVVKGTVKALKFSKSIHSGSYDISQFSFPLSELIDI